MINEPEFWKVAAAWVASIAIVGSAVGVFVSVVGIPYGQRVLQERRRNAQLIAMGRR